MRGWPAAVLAAVVIAGCGLNVQSADLFKVTRFGADSQRLTMLVNDSGTIACNGGKPKPLPDRMLLQARDLADQLGDDVKLQWYPSRRSVFTYTVKVQKGTFSFPDVAAATRKELSQLELFVVQAAANPCGVGS